MDLASAAKLRNVLLYGIRLHPSKVSPLSLPVCFVFVFSFIFLRWVQSSCAVCAYLKEAKPNNGKKNPVPVSCHVFVILAGLPSFITHVCVSVCVCVCLYMWEWDEMFPVFIGLHVSLSLCVCVLSGSNDGWNLVKKHWVCVGLRGTTRPLTFQLYDESAGCWVLVYMAQSQQANWFLTLLCVPHVAALFLHLDTLMLTFWWLNMENVY